jgi:hypothetical protein
MIIPPESNRGRTEAGFPLFKLKRFHATARFPIFEARSRLITCL